MLRWPPFKPFFHIRLGSKERALHLCASVLEILKGRGPNRIFYFFLKKSEQWPDTVVQTDPSKENSLLCIVTSSDLGGAEDCPSPGSCTCRPGLADVCY